MDSKQYSPIDLFKLYTYGYFNGVRSSRKIERECYLNIEVMWLINELKPDFKTIADFRKNNKAQIRQAFRKFSMICDEPDFETAKAGGTKLYIGCSRYGLKRNAWYTEAARIMAEKLSCEMVEFPGHLGSFMDRPAEWSKIIRETAQKANW